MPNWCSNIIEFSEESEKTEEFKKWLTEHNQDFSRGHLPDDDGNNTKRYLFDLYYEEGTDYFACTSKWVPPINEMMVIADKYEFSFRLEYEEPGNCEFGAYEYDHKSKNLAHKRVPMEEYPEYDEETDEDYPQSEKLERILSRIDFENVNLT